METPDERKQPRRMRVYEQWQGNETFFFWGHMVAGPNWRASVGTALLLLAPTGIFLGFVAPYVAREVHAVILVFSCLLPAMAGVFLFLTACRDPGIITRQEPDEEYLAGRTSRTKEVLVNTHRVLIRYNDTCHFYQPPRAHHCSVNDNCIERFDHHCPWVGTTIGKRNYRTFLLFIFTATILCLYVCGVCLAQLFLKHKELADAATDGSNQWGATVRQVIPALVIMGYTFIFFWFVGGLSGFHCYLVGSNQTTYENFRYNHDNRPNPYDMGILRNCAQVFCTPTPPSQVDFRAFVDEVKPRPAFPSNLELAPPTVSFQTDPDRAPLPQQYGAMAGPQLYRPPATEGTGRPHVGQTGSLQQTEPSIHSGYTGPMPGNAQQPGRYQGHTSAEQPWDGSPGVTSQQNSPVVSPLVESNGEQQWHSPGVHSSSGEENTLHSSSIGSSQPSHNQQQQSVHQQSNLNAG
mmetsp:Transcript_17328/g.29618  ORF Transcript_17328/g.29618 Transcript_17328/m.29618 type:complete len:463 (-) Transcript_17328:349-1737(-)|eukprot:CAMPEP_0119105144 /NCGR_PEP_ID=MMETSP1180-20130426/3188_1 /TAXON_ID=3052 ORGANISM="Chlamydomonas cf sp, Strain CCMP681" /NCGR_SAMPLE_ID=MMETSP1180 /ASSEMBLY_ACC=CAM_ASM_000741 /LENGTH=462 /DNA_ID=CAMNT_0007090127 /DNA_START=298 /DNA_END=1686 /DNA_ORIENTATION=+